MILRNRLAPSKGAPPTVVLVDRLQVIVSAGLDRGRGPRHSLCLGTPIRRVIGNLSGQSRLGRTLKQTPRRVEKPWGFELIWAETEKYVGKLLHIRAGEALSLQYHEHKDETIHLLAGEMKFSAGASAQEVRDVDLRAGESFHVAPGTLHRMVAVTDCDVLEASTPHLGDVVRLEDRYGRIPHDE